MREGAQRAIYRYSKWPTQAITYNLGKNAIIQLREAYRQARGSSYWPKEFHERFMKMGMIPPGYYRESFWPTRGVESSRPRTWGGAGPARARAATGQGTCPQRQYPSAEQYPMFL